MTPTTFGHRARSIAGAASFGHRLADVRKATGLSQLRLATAADVSTRHLSFLESGRSSPSRCMIDRLTEALGADAETRAGLYEAAGLIPLQDWRESTSADGPRVDPGAAFGMALALQAERTIEGALEAARRDFALLGLDCPVPQRNAACLEPSGSTGRALFRSSSRGGLPPELELASRVLQTALAETLARLVLETPARPQPTSAGKAARVVIATDRAEAPGMRR